MAKITLLHSGPLGLPDGTVLRPNVATEVKSWEVLKNHNVVKAWINAGLFEGIAAAKSSTDGSKKAAGGGASTPAANQSEADRIIAERNQRIADEEAARLAADAETARLAEKARLQALQDAGDGSGDDGNGGSGELTPEQEAEALEALKARAKELKIKFTWNTKPETLREKIAEEEAKAS